MQRTGPFLSIGYGDFSFGLYEKALPSGLSFRDRLLRAREAGYDFLEISIDISDERLARLDWSSHERHELQKIIIDTQVPITTLCLSGLARYPAGSVHADLRSKGIEIIEKAIHLAGDLGIRVVQLAGYDELNNEESNDETASNLFESISRALKLAGRMGVCLSIENIGYTRMNSLETIMKYVCSFNTPFLTAYADVGNLHAANFDLRRQFEIAKGHITAVHMKDAKEGVTRRVPFGSGTVDFIEVFRVIRDTRFFGPLVVEMWSDESKDSFKAARDAKLFLLEKMKRVWSEERI